MDMARKFLAVLAVTLLAFSTVACTAEGEVGEDGAGAGVEVDGEGEGEGEGGDD